MVHASGDWLDSSSGVPSVGTGAIWRTGSSRTRTCRPRSSSSAAPNRRRLVPTGRRTRSCSGRDHRLATGAGEIGVHAGPGVEGTVPVLIDQARPLLGRRGDGRRRHLAGPTVHGGRQASQSRPRPWSADAEVARPRSVTIFRPCGTISRRRLPGAPAAPRSRHRRRRRSTRGGSAGAELARRSCPGWRWDGRRRLDSRAARNGGPDGCRGRRPLRGPRSSWSCGRVRSTITGGPESGVRTTAASTYPVWRTSRRLSPTTRWVRSLSS